MAGGKETPRQKMIGIMYLVLMAMLALNVSNTVLDAFKTVRDGLEKGNDNMNDRLKFIMTLFENYYNNAPQKAEANFNKAKEAKKIGDGLVAEIEKAKQELIALGDGLDEKSGDIKKRDDLDVSNKELVVKKKGDELQAKIEAAAKKMGALINQSPKIIGLELEWPKINPKEKTKQSWALYNFGPGKPLTSTITLLAKFQNDVKNAEAYVINKLYQETTGGGIVDSYKAVAVAKSSYVIAGQPYEADVFLTASSSSIPINVSVNGSAIKSENGLARYAVGTAKDGNFQWTGTVSFKDPNDGTIKTFKTDPINYTVAKPSAVVSPDKLNVLYIGVKNPLSVSAPGISADKIKMSISSGSLSGANGKYNAIVSKGPAEVVVTVSAEIEPGKSQLLGKSVFKVKQLPDPDPSFLNSFGGDYVKYRQVTSSAAVLKAEYGADVLFNMDFQVLSFDLKVREPRQTPSIRRSLTNSSLRGLLANLKGNESIEFFNIEVMGDDKIRRKLKPSVALDIE